MVGWVGGWVREARMWTKLESGNNLFRAAVPSWGTNHSSSK